MVHGAAFEGRGDDCKGGEGVGGEGSQEGGYGDLFLQVVVGVGEVDG